MSKKAATLLIAAVLPLGAQAATETWDFSTEKTNTLPSQTLYVDGDNDGTADLEVTGWSDTGSRRDDKLQKGTLNEYISWDGNVYYGVGLTNKDEDPNSPEHSIDNYSGDTDMVLLSFNEAVTLEGITIGWDNADQADVTIVGYEGLGDFSINEGVDTWESIADTGLWTTVAEYLNVSTGFHAVDEANQFSSKYWLVGACNIQFNSNLLTSSGRCGDGESCSTGGFKLASVTGSTPDGGDGGEVPAPASALLVLAGLLAMQRSRKGKSLSLTA